MCPVLKGRRECALKDPEGHCSEMGLCPLSLKKTESQSGWRRVSKGGTPCLVHAGEAVGCVEFGFYSEWDEKPQKVFEMCDMA